MLLHAKLGAAIASERFAVRDPQVLSAIEKHTTAAREMSPLDCIVYLADSLEPNRSFPERADLWSLALGDLVGAMRAVLLLTMRHNAVSYTHLTSISFGSTIRAKSSSWALKKRSTATRSCSSNGGATRPIFSRRAATR